MSIKYDAPASLHKWDSVSQRRPGDVQSFASRIVWEGTLKGCVHQFLERPKAQQALYEIMVGEEAGLGKTILEPDDVVAIAEREDFPTG